MPDGNDAQSRIVAQQIAETAITVFAAKHPELFVRKEPEVPQLVKWVVGTVAALGLAAMIGGGTWLVSSVSSMQGTLIRMEERIGSGSVRDSRVDDIERRVRQLEAYHQGGGA